MSHVVERLSAHQSWSFSYARTEFHAAQLHCADVYTGSLALFSDSISNIIIVTCHIECALLYQIMPKDSA